jgi:hypothetical protein
MLDLLHALPQQEAAALRCYGFATPAIGNAALADLVQRRWWHAHFNNFLLPGMPPASYVCSWGRHVRATA